MATVLEPRFNNHWGLGDPLTPYQSHSINKPVYYSFVDEAIGLISLVHCWLVHFCYQGWHNGYQK